MQSASPAPSDSPTASPAPSPKRVRTGTFTRAKASGRRITALTSYDALTAQIFDEAGIDLLLVGDSAANVVYGRPTTLSLEVEELLPLVKAVAGATNRAFVLADLPFGTYEDGPAQALRTAVRLMKEGGAHGVKLEGGVRSAAAIRAVTDAGIPVVGHIGFTPQSEHALGGHVIQGKQDDAVERLLADALAVQDAGAFAIVLELMPREVAARITRELRIPTIGIGAGPKCDGQILVWQDALGLTAGRVPRFVRAFASLREDMLRAVTEYRDEVAAGTFPADAESYERS